MKFDSYPALIFLQREETIILFLLGHSFRFDYDGKQVTRTNIKGLIYVHLQFSHGQLYVALSLSRATDMRKLSMYFILS